MPDRQALPGEMCREAAAARLAAGLAQAPTGLILLTAGGVVDFANVAFETALGASGLTGRRLTAVAPHLFDPDGTPISGGTPAVTWSRQADGGFLGICDAARPAPAMRMPDRDPLTGFLSAQGLTEALGALSQTAPETPGDVAAIYLDLDYFQRAVETLGPDGGDTLLRRVAARLRPVIRAGDLAARLGHDEFVLALYTDGGRDGPAEIALRLCEMLARPFLVNGHQILIGASVGLALRSQSTGTAGDVIRLAKIAMEDGRRTARGQIRWYESAMSEALRERRFIENGLRRALLLDEFEVFYQPQFDFAQDTITGFEALIRWRHSERGLISPVTFIPIAEEMALLPAIGAWVLRAACTEAASWAGNLTIAVNVSPIQFEMADFVAVVEHALKRSGLAPGRLELELTEAGLLRHEASTVARMNALRALGVRLALDDFGTGYASLNYLRQFPFDKIKMDQSFVRGPTADVDTMRIVQAVAQLGQSFGMTVLAEGVETRGQLEDVRARGCDSVQGYLFSKPMPAHKVKAFIAHFSSAHRPAGPIVTGSEPS